MALSGEFTGYTTHIQWAEQFGLYCTWSGVQSIDKNCTDITINVYLSYQRVGVSAKTCTVSVGGISAQFVSASVNGGVSGVWTKSYLGKVTVSVPHNSDGSKNSCNISVTFPYSGTMNGVSVPNITASVTVDLDPIPRVSIPTLSVSTAVMGNLIRVYTNRKSTAFTHRITWAFGNGSGVISEGAGDYADWYPDVSLAAQIPSVWSGSGTIYCETFHNGTSIGIKTVPFTLTVPDSDATKPKITISSVSGVDLFGEMYLQGISKVRIAYSVEMPCSNYNSLSVSLIDASGNTVCRLYGDWSSAESGIISASGEFTLMVTAYNSRGNSRTVYAEQKIYVHSYSPPSVAVSICERCSDDGILRKNGLKLKLAASRKYTPLDGKNQCVLRYRIKKYDGTSFSSSAPWNTLIENGDISTNYYEDIISSVEKKSAYSVEIGVEDSVGKSSSVIKYVKTTLVNLHLGPNGDRAAFGMWCQQAGLEIAFETQFDSGFRFQEEEIFVGGDKDTYYPVLIILSYPYYYQNTQPTFLGIGKKLRSSSPAWTGNHSSGSSSLSIAWIFRFGGWDGNGSFCNTLYKSEDYAKLIADFKGLMKSVAGVVAYLRGGGSSYQISCSAPYTAEVFLESKNIETTEYPNILSPTTTIGNGGIYYLNSGPNLT